MIGIALRWQKVGGRGSATIKIHLLPPPPVCSLVCSRPECKAFKLKAFSKRTFISFPFRLSATHLCAMYELHVLEKSHLFGHNDAYWVFEFHFSNLTKADFLSPFAIPVIFHYAICPFSTTPPNMIQI